MPCPQCQHENPVEATFCDECGSRLEAGCAACGEPNRPGAKFCRKCGQPLIQTDSGRQTNASRFPSPERYTPKHLAERILTSKAALEGERKQVTVLFADLKGSMELLADRDPEEARKILDPVLELMMEAVHRYEGTVNQVMGDGIMALFGAPLAHEDHAVRACYAALRMQESVKSYAEGVRRDEGVTIRIRVGLNSGEVVVRAIGSDLRMDYTAVGQTTHLAARMEQLSGPGSILLAPETLALAEGFVNVRALGPMTVKGLPAPIEVHELTGVSAVRSRLQAGAMHGLSRFVGREAENEQLRRALEQARQGRGQIAAIVGEPGVGKSRLVFEVTHSHRVEGWLVLQTGSVSYGRATSYLPVIDLLRGYFRVGDRDTHREIREKVTGKILTLDPTLEPMLAALLSLLDVPVDDREWQALAPPQRRQRTLDSVKWLLLREAQAQPLVVVFEDLHWIDEATQALLDGLVESLPSVRCLLLVNYRPEYAHRWGSKTSYTQIRLDPLPPESVLDLLHGLLGQDATSEALKPILIERTEGNPLFLEESVRALVETGALVGERGAYRLARPLTDIQVPATVQAILAARIDRLSPEEKRVLQSAAVVGTEAPLILLQEIAEEGAADLHGHLAQLQAAEFLYESQIFPDFEYAFRHVLIHDVAYRSLSQARRRTLHARIADAIERLQPTRFIEDVDRLAYHTYRGEVWDKAVRYSQQAGVKAQQRSAHREAVAWFEQGLAALAHLPKDAVTSEQAIDLRLDLRGPLYSLGELERMHVYLREAESLAEQLGDARRIGWVCIHLGEYSRQTGHFREACTLIWRAGASAGTLGDLPLRLAADQYLGMALHALGDYRRAAEHQRRAAEFPEEHTLAGFGPTQAGSAAGFRAVSLSWLARCLAEVGEFVEGIKYGREAIRLAEENERAYTLVSACWGLGYLYGVRGDLDSAILLLDRALAAARGAGLTRLLPQVMRALGLAHALAGRVAAGTALLEEALVLVESIHLRVAESSSLALLAEVYLLAGRTDDAMASGTRALAVARRGEQRGEEAVALHVLGDIEALREPRDAEAAEGHLRAAVGLAEEFSMRPLVARSRLSLGGFYRRAGDRSRARPELEMAAAMFREMGMRLWLARAEAEG